MGLYIPGAWFVLRSRLAADWKQLPVASRYVLTCQTGMQAWYAAPEVAALAAAYGAEIQLLEGGTVAWCRAGYPVESGLDRPASEPMDRYKRPYEGTDNPHAAMQGYLDWEYGLIAQLAKDGTHGFRILLTELPQAAAECPPEIYSE